MRESQVEKYLVDQVKKRGGVAEKFKSPGRKNVPDRIVLWPAITYRGAPVWPPEAHFVELKALLGKTKAGQTRDHARRRKMGFKVFVLRSKTDVDCYLRDHAPTC